MRNLKPTLPPNARNRRADKWRSLFAIAEIAWEEWPKRVLRAYLSEEQDDTAKLDTALQLLVDIREVLKPSEHVITTEELIERLCGLDESPWMEYNFKERDEYRRKLQARRISKLLKDYRVKPDTVRPKGASPAKGYKRTDFEIAWKRYLSAAPTAAAVTTLQTSNGAASSESPSVTAFPFVTATNTPQPTTDAACNGLTDNSPDTFINDDDSVIF